MIERIENRLGKGMPDVVACLRLSSNDPPVSSFIELKHAEEWPKRASTPLHFNHFGEEQVLWLEAWHRAGGLCCVLAQVEREYLLIGPWHASEIAAGMTREAMIRAALVYSRKVFPTGQILKCLTGSALNSPSSATASGFGFGVAHKA